METNRKRKRGHQKIRWKDDIVAMAGEHCTVMANDSRGGRFRGRPLPSSGKEMVEKGNDYEATKIYCISC